MSKYYEEWNGKKYPIREVMFEVCSGMETLVKVAGIELWDAIEEACEHKEHPQHAEAYDLNCEIYYYCDYGYIDSNPTDEDIVKRMLTCIS